MAEQQNTTMTTDKTPDQNSNCSSVEKSADQAGKGNDNLDDLLSTLKQQIDSSDWLKKNTAEKWTNENPELAKEYMEAMKKS